MANDTSSWKNISGYEARKYRAYVSASATEATDTAVTLSVTGRCEAKYLSGYGCRVRVYIGGTQVATKTAVISNSSGTVGEWAEVSGTLTISRGSAAKSIVCKCTVEGETVNGYGGVNGGTATASTPFTVNAITYDKPNAPTGFSSTRSTDTKNVLKWTKPTTSATKPVSAILVERKVDGGSWSQIASVSGTSTSYNDTTTSANHSYQYRIRSSNSAGKSDYVTSGTTYNTPSAPVKVTAARTSGNGVELTIENSAKTATALEIQRSADAETWDTVATVSGSPVTTATDSPGGGTYYYRARNTRGSLASAWSPVSNAVVTIAPPEAPTLLTPASGVAVSKSQDVIELTWAHNPVDGSAQTAAEARWSVDEGASWQVIAIEGNAASYGLSNAFDVNAKVLWSVRTKGAHADFGPWSGNRAFNVYQEPVVTFENPAEGFTVTNMPIAVTLQYEDPSGELVAATVEVASEGRTLWKASGGLSYEIAADEWAPENNATYTATAAVRSSSGLSATAEREFSVEFVPPMSADALVEYDEETGFASLSVYVVQDEALEPVDGISLYREVRGERVLIASGLQDGAGVVDMYAPANIDYSYVLVSVAESGAASTNVVPARLDTQWFYFIWDENVAKGRINPEGKVKVRRPNRRQVHFAKRPLPVSFDDSAVTDERTVSFVLRTKEEADEFQRMMWDGGRCVYKSGDGDVIHADVDLEGSPEWEQPTYYGKVLLSVTRIDGGAL